MKTVYALFIMLAFVGCSSVKTAFDYDKGVDFTKYKTYKFTQNDLAKSINQLNAERVMKAVSTELAAKGLSPSETPDAIVDVHLKTQQMQEATATTTGMGPWGYRWGGGYSTTSINYDTYTEGTMFITIVDAATEKIVWQGTGTKTLNENASADKREETISYSIQQIMSNYPPK